MMDIQETDSQLREIFKRNAPSFDKTGLLSRLRSNKRALSGSPSRKRCLQFGAIALGVLILCAGVAAGVYEGVAHFTRPGQVLVIGDDGTTGPATSPAQLLWSQALSWIRSAPTQAVEDNGNLTITYGDQATILQLISSPDMNDPLPQSWAVANEDFYWQADVVDGNGNSEVGQTVSTIVVHATPAMAVETDNATYFHDNPGIIAVGMISALRMCDPYHILNSCEPEGAPQKLATSNWLLKARAFASDVVGTDIKEAIDFERALGNLADAKLDVTLEVTPQGVPVATTITPASSELSAGDELITFYWSRATAAPEIPAVAMEFDAWAKGYDQQQRGTIEEVVKQSTFTVYWLGESYQGIALSSAQPFDGTAMLLYWPPTARQNTASTVANADIGYTLFEYSVSNPPDSEKPFVASKTLYRSFGQGDNAYSVYTTAKDAPGHSILVRRGDTYISVSSSGASGDIFNQLLAVAAALQRAEP